MRFQGLRLEELKVALFDLVLKVCGLICALPATAAQGFVTEQANSMRFKNRHPFVVTRNHVTPKRY